MLLVIPYIFPSTFNALAVWPFIILKERSLKSDSVLLYHERIHLRQQLEMLWIFFFLFYVLEYAVKIVIYRDLKTAYHNISFEREAYSNEHDGNYLSNRAFLSFLKYL